MATLLVNDVTPRVQYTASGSQTVFAYGFPIFVDSDLKVYIGSTLKTLTTHYTVSGAGTTAGGNVTLGTGASAGDIVTIYRDLPVSRTSDYQTGGDLLAETLNDDLDKVVMMAQQNERDLNNRTLRFGQFTTGIPLAEFTESATDRANKVLAFDASGDPNITQELGTFEGNWAASTAYEVRDLVKDTSNGNIYICLTAHTSSGAQPISSNTDAAKWALIVDAASATSSASAAATSATAAATSATASAASATTSTAQAVISTAQAVISTAQATASAASASAASTSQSAAATSATAAAASYDSFDDRYLGTKSSDPTVDNDGATLLDGALYWNTSTNVFMVYDLGGTAWNRTIPTSADQTKINTVSGIAANVTSVANIASDVTAVAADASDIGVVAADGSDIGLVAGSIANVNLTGGSIANVNLTGGSITNVNNVGGSIANVNTVGAAIADVNRYAAEYTISGSAPGSPSAGDLWYDSGNTILKYYTGSAWTGIAPGVTTEVDPNAAALALALG